MGGGLLTAKKMKHEFDVDFKKLMKGDACLVFVCNFCKHVQCKKKNRSALDDHLNDASDRGDALLLLQYLMNREFVWPVVVRDLVPNLFTFYASSRRSVRVQRA